MPRNRGLTEDSIEALSFAKKGRYEVMDSATQNLSVRIGTKKKAFVYIGRIANGKDPVRRTIGYFPKTTLDEARAIAIAWGKQVARGLDPKEERKKAEAKEAMTVRRTAKSVLEDYIADLPSRPRNRQVPKEIATIRREFLDPDRNPWLGKPLAEVTAKDISIVIGAIRDRPAMGQAFNCFGYMKSFFDWAMSPERREDYGLSQNPFEGTKPKQLKLYKKKRTVLPNIYEVRAYWTATTETPYPYGRFFEAVLLVGAVRKTELARARWPEFDFEMKLWTVPRARVKNGEQNLEHLVPLTDEMIALLQEIRRSQGPNHGDYVFSTTNGQKPINGFSKAMTALRARMQKILLEMKPEAAQNHIRLHDTRRLVRSALAEIGVPDVVAELVIGHGLKGIQGLYNQYLYLPQIRNALTLFARSLKEIVEGRADSFASEGSMNWHMSALAGGHTS